jgi:hypothetical protein
MIERGMDFPLRNERGALYTVGLFRETSSTPDSAVFTLGSTDHGSQPSLYLLYRSFDDPTEYEFAMTIFGEWRAWNTISNNPKIKPFVDSWREELEMKLRSEGIVKLREQAQSGNSTAARWLGEAGWRPKTRGPKPQKEVQRQERVQAGVKEHVEKHYHKLQRVK